MKRRKTRKIWPARIPGKTWPGRHASVISMLPEHLAGRKKLHIVEVGTGARVWVSGSIHPQGDPASFGRAKKAIRYFSDVVDSVGRRLPLPAKAYATYEPFELYRTLSEGRKVRLTVVDNVNLEKILKNGPADAAKNIDFIQQDIRKLRLSEPADVLFAMNVRNIGELISNNRQYLKNAVIVCTKMEESAERKIGLRMLATKEQGRTLYKLK